MSSDDDMVDITTTGTTQEGALSSEYQYPTQGEYLFYLLQMGKII